MTTQEMLSTIETEKRGLLAGSHYYIQYSHLEFLIARVKQLQSGLELVMNQEIETEWVSETKKKLVTDTRLVMKIGDALYSMPRGEL